MRKPATASEQSRRERRLALLVDSVVDYAIFLLDTDGRVASWNAGAQRIKGYTADEIIGEHFSRFYSDEDRRQRRPDRELEVAAREGRFEEEGWRFRRDGSRFWANVVITAIREETGELVGFGKVTRDLTARRLDEEMLRSGAAELRAANEELAQFGRLVAAVRDYAIFLLDPGGHVTTWNAGAEHLKGYAAQEVLGRHFSLFYTDEDRLRNHPAAELEIAAREGRYEEEGWRIRKDGSRFWAQVTITAVRDDRGFLSGFAKVTRDMTKRRETDERLRAAQAELERANADLKRFATVAAHDLREPLATAGAFADLLASRERERLSDTGRHQLEHLTGSIARMRQLIDDLLTYASLGADEGGLRRVALAECLPPVVRSLDAVITQRGATVRSDLPEDACVLAEPSGVHVLLQNLVSNALKYGDREHPSVLVEAHRDEDGWRLTVADNGAGVTPADRERIFDAFHRLPEAGPLPGIGLGLAICKRVVDRAGGRIGVDSPPGGGSRFWVWLRAAG